MHHDSPAGHEHRLKLGGHHGYQIEGDTASLNADLAIAWDTVYPAGWALQLWACEQPYEGGLLQGTKVAQVPVAWPAAPTTAGGTRHFEAQTVANIPALRRDYAMVLVLASGESDSFEQVQDFANYPKRELFVVPHLEGSVGYSIEEGSVQLTVDRIENPRPSGTLSGSLSLELRALSQPYAGGVPDGTVLATAHIGQIGGGCALGPVEHTVAFSPPPAGNWRLALLLREWTAAGFAIRDCCNFPVSFERSGRENGTAPRTARHDDALSDPSHEEIALAAYYRYLARGGAHGDALNDWLEAEQELRRAR